MFLSEPFEEENFARTVHVGMMMGKTWRKIRNLLTINLKIHVQQIEMIHESPFSDRKLFQETLGIFFCILSLHLKNSRRAFLVC